jgi:hypothetical protein
MNYAFNVRHYTTTRGPWYRAGIKFSQLVCIIEAANAFDAIEKVRKEREEEVLESYYAEIGVFDDDQVIWEATETHLGNSPDWELPKLR